MGATSALTGKNWARGPKLQQKVNLGGLKKVVFFRGPKSQLYKT